MTKDRVCFISCSERADDNRISRLRNVLIEEGYQVYSVMVEPFSNEYRYDEHSNFLPVLKNSLYPHSTSISLVKAIIQRARNFIIALRFCISIKPDICQCHEPDSWIIGIVMKLVYKSKIVVDYHEPFETRASAFPKPIRSFMRRIIRGAMKLMSNNLDYIIHVNKTIANLYSDFNCPQIVIGNYPELKLFSIATKSNNVKYSDKNEKKILIYAGPIRRSIYAYNHKIFIEAIEICINSNPNLIFYIVGGIDHQYNEIIQRINNKDRLIIFPRLPYKEVINLINESDIGLSLEIPVDPLYNCATPRKLYDYLAAGKPVISSNIPESSSIIEKWNCGVISKNNTPEGIARTILSFVNDDRLPLFSKNSKIASIKQYNWELEYKKVIEIYKSFSIISA